MKRRRWYRDLPMVPGVLLAAFVLMCGLAVLATSVFNLFDGVLPSWMTWTVVCLVTMVALLYCGTYFACGVHFVATARALRPSRSYTPEMPEL